MTTPDPRRNGEANGLPRDEALSRLYREQADRDRTGPPAALDARLLAAAREAIATPRRPARAPLPWWRRLVVPVSLAAVLLVSATLTLMVHDERQKLEAPAPPAPHAPETAPSGAAPAAPPARAPVLRQESAERDQFGSTAAERGAPAASSSSNQAPAAIVPEPKARAATRADESARGLGKSERGPAADKATAKSAPASQALPRPSPDAFPAEEPAAPAPDAASGAAAVGAGAAPGAAVGRTRAPAPPPGEGRPPVPVLRQAPQMPEAAAPAVATPPPGGVAAEPAMRSRDAMERESRPQPRLEQKAARSPEAWLEEIRELRRAGREAEWREALARFRARYPDVPLPADLR